MNWFEGICTPAACAEWLLSLPKDAQVKLIKVETKSGTHEYNNNQNLYVKAQRKEWSKQRTADRKIKAASDNELSPTAEKE